MLRPWGFHMAFHAMGRCRKWKKKTGLGWAGQAALARVSVSVCVCVCVCVHGQSWGCGQTTPLVDEPEGVVRDAENILCAHESNVVEWKLTIILAFTSNHGPGYGFSWGPKQVKQEHKPHEARERI